MVWLRCVADAVRSVEKGAVVGVPTEEVRRRLEAGRMVASFDSMDNHLLFPGSNACFGYDLDLGDGCRLGVETTIE